jgi:aminoglycoside phosphotransferase (APT) family kinase protein
MTLTHSGNTIYAASLVNGKEIIVRIRGDSSGTFSKTVPNILALRQLGLPTPRVLTADTSRTVFPFDYILLERIPGRDLLYELPTMTRPQMSRLAAQIVDYQQRVGTLPLGTGYGWGAIGEGGTESRWLFCLESGAVPPAGGCFHTQSFRRRLFEMQVRLQPYFNSVGPVCFLEDLTTKNVLLRDGELTGLIDFDCVCFGDPLWQVGLAAGCIVNDVGVDGLFYVEELCRYGRLSGVQEQAVRFYSALRATEFLEMAITHGDNTTVQRLSNRIEFWLAQQGYE